MKFSDRIGLTKPKTKLEKESLSSDLRITLWNVVLEYILKSLSDWNVDGNKYSPLVRFFHNLYLDFFKWPLDSLPIEEGGRFGSSKHLPYESLREWFLKKAEWHEVYNLIEFCAQDFPVFIDVCNIYLKRELSAYRFVGKQLCEINSEEEIMEIESTLNVSDTYGPVKTHINSALKLLSDKKNPDFRNSIKESISAIESLCKIITKDKNATLGKALKSIEKNHPVPKSLTNAYSILYGYSSDNSGIRHGLWADDYEVGIDEARYILVSSSAFINFLISKI